jgi:SAM-dependent methyltransferase
MAKVTGPQGRLVYKPISPLWHRARMGLSYGTNINNCEYVADGMEVGEARSYVAAGCLRQRVTPTFLFLIDSDVIVPNDAFTKLFYHLKTKPWVDIAAGVYVVKGAPPYDPLIYRENGEGAFWDWAVGDILTTKQHGIRSVHMGLTLIRVSLFQRMKDAGLVHGDGTDMDDEPFFKTTDESWEEPGRGRQTHKGTEDIYFCEKARRIDAQILVDTSVLAGHLDEATGIVYGLPGDTSPIERAMWLPLPDGSGRRKDRVEAEANEELCEFCGGKGEIFCKVDEQPCIKCKGTGKVKAPLKLALDLGAGESHRTWKGYRTYRLDARRDTEPDYCQEMENLNLPSDHFDLVASRHSFEHVGPFDQERLWKEAYRVCRPGGRLEVILPNLEWAAAKIAAGEYDMHVRNVIYGGAETDLHMKEAGAIYNVHRFGYTPAVAKALAEQAGFVDVGVSSYLDDPGAQYHMQVLARKPAKLGSEATTTKEEQNDESLPGQQAGVLNGQQPVPADGSPGPGHADPRQPGAVVEAGAGRAADGGGGPGAVPVGVGVPGEHAAEPPGPSGAGVGAAGDADCEVRVGSLPGDDKYPYGLKDH